MNYAVPHSTNLNNESNWPRDGGRRSSLGKGFRNKCSTRRKHDQHQLLFVWTNVINESHESLLQKNQSKLCRQLTTPKFQTTRRPRVERHVHSATSLWFPTDCSLNWCHLWCAAISINRETARGPEPHVRRFSKSNKSKTKAKIGNRTPRDSRHCSIDT